MVYREEKDSLGKKNINNERLYGIQTQRALENFEVDYRKTPNEIIKELIRIKRCCAVVNTECGFLDSAKSSAIIKSCDELLKDFHSEDFPISAMQGGAGTSTNMNVNEVIANLAIERLNGEKGDYTVIHPNDDVNKFQSTNDVYPTAVKVSVIKLLFKLSEELAELQTAFQDKEKEFSDILKVGRTETRDAVPVTLGLEFGAYAEAIGRDRWRVYKSEERLRTVNLGGTAIGTGTGAPKIFIFKLIEELRKAAGLGISRAENSLDATQNMDAFVEVSGILKAVAVNFLKISGDLRFLSSGPRAGIGEIELPAVQPGSSIMPGKVNPVMPEFLASVGIQVIANDSAITTAASMGLLELNAFLPVIAYNLIDSVKLLIGGSKQFRIRCLEGIEADVKRCNELLEKSNCMAVLLTPYLGYDKTAELVEYANDKDISVREAAVRLNHFTTDEISEIFNPRKATSPGIAGAERLENKLNL